MVRVRIRILTKFPDLNVVRKDAIFINANNGSPPKNTYCHSQKDKATRSVAVAVMMTEMMMTTAE